MISSMIDLELDVRNKVSEEFPDLLLAFTFSDPISPRGGELFKQDEDFVLVLLDYTSEDALLSDYNTARVEGAVEFYVASRDDLNDIKHKRLLEKLCRVFTHKALLGVHFRGINPGTAVSYRGFTMYPGEVPFLAKLKPQEV